MTKKERPGARLRSFRKERGLSGQALADAIGVTRSTVSYWEAGRTALPWTVCLALEAVHGVSATWLSTGEGPMWIVQSKRRVKAGKDFHLIPFLDSELGFDSDGLPIEPHPETPTLGFPSVLLSEVLGGTLPERGLLYLWRVIEDDMAPLLPRDSWVLLDAAPQAREVQIENAIYLIRLGRERIPCLRRIATEPVSGDLLIAADAPGRVPLRCARTATNTECTILAHALWAGIHLF